MDHLKFSGMSELLEQKTTLPETDETQTPPWGYNELPF